MTRRAFSLSSPRLIVVVGALLAVLALTLMPRTIVAPVRGAVMRVAYALAEPAVSGMTFNQVEGTLNTLVFIPLGAALTIVLGRSLWLFAPLFAFGISFTIEYLQAQVPGRVPDVNDIVWNTVGGLIGACVVALIRMIRGVRVGGDRGVQVDRGA